LPGPTQQNATWRRARPSRTVDAPTKG